MDKDDKDKFKLILNQEDNYSLLNKKDIDNGNKTVDDLSLEELEDVGELYKFEVSKLSSEVKRLEREKMVIELRFGLIDGRIRTLEETGNMLEPKVTRERVRQIEAKALR